MSTVLSEPAVAPPAPARVSLYQFVRAAVIMTPLFAVHLALLAIPFLALTWWDLLGVFLITRVGGLGVTVGLHRYFTHRSFKTSRWFQFVLGMTGCTALQRGPLWWAAHHRLHHRHSDTADDVHSPVTRGFWHGHFGWLFEAVGPAPDYTVIRDLLKYRELVWLERFWLVPPAALAAACYALGGWNGLVVWYCLGVVFVLQITFAVNSLGHLFGPQRFDTGEGSRNNLILGYLALGDGWHNNHHRAPTSARHGFAWYEFDLSFLTIRVLAVLRLVWGVKLPPAGLMAKVGAPAAARSVAG